MSFAELESCERCDLDRDQLSLSFIVGDRAYYSNLRSTTCWWHLDDITTLGRLVAHNTHREDIVYLPILYEGGVIPIGTKIELAEETKVDVIVSTALVGIHFATIKIFLKQKRVEIIYDRGTLPLKRWEPSVLSILRSCRICDELTGWELVGNYFIDDGYNCGPRACVALLKVFQPLSVPAAEMDGGQCREFAVDKLLQLLQWSGVTI